MGPCVRDVDGVGGPRGPSVGVWESVGWEKVCKVFGKLQSLGSNFKGKEKFQSCWVEVVDEKVGNFLGIN